MVVVFASVLFFFSVWFLCSFVSCDPMFFVSLGLRRLALGVFVCAGVVDSSQCRAGILRIGEEREYIIPPLPYTARCCFVGRFTAETRETVESGRWWEPGNLFLRMRRKRQSVRTYQVYGMAKETTPQLPRPPTPGFAALKRPAVTFALGRDLIGSDRGDEGVNKSLNHTFFYYFFFLLCF